MSIGTPIPANQAGEALVFSSPYFVIGLLTVTLYAWRQFNEPSFQKKDALPRTITPLRYLFLSTAYPWARMIYVLVSMVLYCLLVWPGPTMLSTLNATKDVSPTQAWPLLVALFLIGVIPNSNAKWLTMVEEQLRRAVHAWFLVPSGTERIIGLLEDARFEPRPSQMSGALAELRSKLDGDLSQPRGSLRYRWALATLLMASLKQMNAGEPHALSRDAFTPFEDDFRALVERYKLLQKDVAGSGDPSRDGEAEENLAQSVKDLLRNLYAYISWGVRYPARSDRDIYRTLKEVGFEFRIQTERRLFDLVVPATFAVAAIMLASSVGKDGYAFLQGSALEYSQVVQGAASSALAAGLMYGGAVWVLLRGRALQIEHRVWRHGSPRRLLSIALQAGLLTWGVIMLSTVVVDLPKLVRSIDGLREVAASLARTREFRWQSEESWWLPSKVLGSVPWVLLGAAASVVLASCLGGDIRRRDKAGAWRDAAVVGCGLAVSAVLAFLLQGALGAAEDLRLAFDWPTLVRTTWTAADGFACGAVVGFMVPHASRAELVRPFETTARRALNELLQEAESKLGSRAAAMEWAFKPYDELGGIAAAEAVRYKGYTAEIGRLLEDEASARREAARPGQGERGAPVVITGGRAAG